MLGAAPHFGLLLGSTTSHIGQVDRSGHRGCFWWLGYFGFLGSGVVVLIVAGKARLRSGPIINHGRIVRVIGLLMLEKDLFPEVIDALPCRTTGFSVMVALPLNLAHYARFSHRLRRGVVPLLRDCRRPDRHR